MIRFLFACLAIICTLLGLGMICLIGWGVASLIDAFLFLFPIVGTIFSIIVFLGFFVWMIMFGYKIIWMFASSLYETFCETFIKK